MRILLCRRENAVKKEEIDNNLNIEDNDDSYYYHYSYIVTKEEISKSHELE